MKARPIRFSDPILGKLFSAYDKAEGALIKRRDELFPPGTKVQSPLYEGGVDTVQAGSLYAHQVFLGWGHVSWRNLKKIESNDGNENG